MTVINNLDLGAHSTWNASLSTRKGATWGEDVQSLVVEGGQSTVWQRSGIVRKRTETIWVSVTPPDSTKALRLVRQFLELAGNPNMQPVYIQWAAGGGTTTSDPEDGWYVLESAIPDLEVSIDGIIPVQITVSYLSPSILSKALAMSYIGSQATVGWAATGAAINWLSFPINSAGMLFRVNRFGGEGYIPVSYQLPLSVSTPQFFYQTGQAADLWKGRVTVYDAINLASNPVPTGGGFANANWIEVLHPDHQFSGDCIISNDLLLLVFRVGIVANNLCAIYFWNPSSNQWQLFGNLAGQDNAGANWILESFTLGRISYRESSIQLAAFTGSGNWIQVTIRIVAGTYFARVQLRALTQTVTMDDPLFLAPTIAPKISYQDTCSILDNTLAAERIAFGSCNVSGFVAAFSNNSAAPYIFGFLYQEGTGQQRGAAHVDGLALSDGLFMTAGVPLINQSRFYGFFVAPYLNPQNLQSEVENSFFQTGWSSIADANASGGNTAKAASGTASGNAAFTNNGWIPEAGVYDVWFRVRVTSAAGATPEMTLGIWNQTTQATIVPGSSTTFAANAASTSYVWLQAASGLRFDPPTIVIKFIARTAATLGTDWFIDEAVIVPTSLPPLQNGPSDLFRQFAFDRQTKVIAI